MAEFIVRENYAQHTAPSTFLSGENLKTVQSILMEDLPMFDDSVICVALEDSEIVGSVKVTKWNDQIIMPIEKLFGINPARFKNNGVKSIWHIGRFAISKTAKEGAKLLRKLIAIAIFPICCATDSIMLAECDSKFVRVLNLLGIKTEILAKGIIYLGSETLPIYSTQKWLYSYLSHSAYYSEAIDFYCINDPGNHLILNDFEQLMQDANLIHTDSITGDDTKLYVI
ncbi:MAG: hypothetical protein M9933_12380 [Chitinophagaceae bacterium]|nr:hypothetical protein [Chitinophagaceae bacterium]